MMPCASGSRLERALAAETDRLSNVSLVDGDKEGEYNGCRGPEGGHRAGGVRLRWATIGGVMR